MRILQRFAADFEPSHGRRARRAIEESPAFGVKKFGDGKVGSAPGSIEIPPVERRLIGVKQRDGRKDLVVERPVEACASNAMCKPARIAPGFRKQAVEGLEGERAASCSLCSS